MKRKFLLLLVGALLFSFLTGCNSENTSADKQNTEIPNIIWYYPGDNSADMEAVLAEANKIIKPAIGANLVLKYIDKGGYKEKMNMMVAAAEKFDICFVANWSYDFYSNVSKSAFLSLDDLIAKHAPNLKKVLPDLMWNAVTIDQQVFAVPNYQILPVQHSLAMNKELENKYKFDFTNVKRLKDLEPYLDILKTNEPSLYPYAPQRSEIDLDYEIVYPTDFIVIKKNDPSAKAYISYMLPEYQEHLKLMRNWYKKGYIRKDIVGSGNDTASLLGLKYGLFWGTIKPGGEIDNLQKFKKEIMDIPMCEPYIPTSASARALTVISRTSPNPDKAIKMIELMHTNKELFNLLMFGLEGKNYNKVGDNVVETAVGNKYSLSPWMFGNQFNAYILKGQAENVWEKTKELNESSQYSPIWGFNFKLDNVKNEITQCTAVVKEYSFITTGAEEPDTYYEEFMKKLEAAGVQKVLNEVQRQIDQWKASN